MNAVLPDLHYGDCTWSSLDPVQDPSRFGVDIAVSELRSLLGRPDNPIDEVGQEVVDWVRRDLVGLQGTDRGVMPEALYQRVAESAAGEVLFVSGASGAARLGYGPLVRYAHEWAVSRFVGLGCPWIGGLPGPGDVVVDIGCGAGLDVAIAAAHVGTAGVAFGIDRLPYLVSAGGAADRGAHLAIARADALPLRAGVADLIVANGLPPLLSARSARTVLEEVRRALRPGGSLRFVTLVAYDDVHLDELPDLHVINSVRCSKPLCWQYRALLSSTGYTDVRIVDNPSPFVDGYRCGPVRSVTVVAARDH